MKLAAAAILLGMAAVQFYTAQLENQSYDEAIHITAGMGYWCTGDYRINVEHPPLAKLLFALPLLAAGLRFDDTSPQWIQPEQTLLGRDFLYRNRLSAGAILALSRRVGGMARSQWKPAAGGRCHSVRAGRRHQVLGARRHPDPRDTCWGDPRTRLRFGGQQVSQPLQRRCSSLPTSASGGAWAG